ncbi:LarC family nickel insertion protein [Desulfosporosinus sp. PR]|uniref:LarC family nickel insertion protein n=1 Tax=Candidatus Desulfosporosinus nitrosoreducens TaxID=3401928 RepID=UPI0027EDE7D7|nr:LarC family nickel insertion protein [Desulfosporosinus sp. PR]MDQ7094903.1 LarC family nickel insertion protein [Desulfosporosinus sp. PR]
MRILYWDTFAGISGDMALGSLIALGANPEAIIDQLHSMGLTEFKLDIRSRQVHGIQATDIDVVIHDHHAKHHHDDDQSEHEHEHEHHHHHHDRRLPDIEKMILSGSLSERSQKHALQVFNALAEAEAHVHGTTLDQVHFHEVGAVDSLVDIVGTCIALDQLDIEEIRISTLPWSKGFVECAHGILPLPAPATLMLLRGFKFRDSGITGELITPTGAALIRALARQADFPEMVIHNVGYGSGKNDYGIPSLLRGVIGEI